MVKNFIWHLLSVKSPLNSGAGIAFMAFIMVCLYGIADRSKTMETIGLYKTREVWMSRCASNEKAFGYTVIPTAFTAKMPKDEVLRRIKALNPNSNVYLIYG